MERLILIHHHIFKNAGTSFNFALKKYFGDRFFEFDLPDSEIILREDLNKFIWDNPTALAISCHHASLFTPEAKKYQTISSILLRKPLARIKSIYKFERNQQANIEGAIKAKELSFKDYVKWRLEVTPVMFCNYQTHYCSRNTKDSPGKYTVKESDFNVAVNNLQKCAIVGTVEQYQNSLKLAQHKLSEYYPDIDLEYSRLNTTSSVLSYEAIRENAIAELGKEIIEEIEEKNQFDEQLYYLAEQIMHKSLERTIDFN